MPVAQFSRETILELARCHARAAFRELVRELETETETKKAAPGKGRPSIHQQHQDQQHDEYSAPITR